jgi:hypothetical protein
MLTAMFVAKVSGKLVQIQNRIQLQDLKKLTRLAVMQSTPFDVPPRAATKLIYLSTNNFKKGVRNVREWFAARNQFAIMFEDRFNAQRYLKPAWARPDTQSS